MLLYTVRCSPSILARQTIFFDKKVLCVRRQERYPDANPAADDFFSIKKFFVFVDESATLTQILRTVYSEKPVRETWRMSLKLAIHYSQTTNRGTKLFFRRIKYCWRKRDERIAIHCSLFAVNFSAADNFFFDEKVLCVCRRDRYLDANPACGKKPVCETWQTSFIDYSPYVVFSPFHPYFAVVCE